MAAKTNSWETDIQRMIFQNLAGSTTTTVLEPQDTGGLSDLYVALFTADPGEAGSTSNECAYGSYARVAQTRDATDWTESSGVISNGVAIDFPEATSGSETATHVGIMTASSGGTMLYYGALTAPLAISTGITPSIAIGALTITED